MLLRQLKFISGLDLIARLNETSPSTDSVLISGISLNPVIQVSHARILTMKEEGNRIQFGFIPYTLSPDDTQIEIFRHALASVTPVHKQIEQAYLEATSGIYLGLD